jgi:hypothetical protein
MQNSAPLIQTSVITPETKAESEIESNSKQIEEIQKLLDSLK